MAIQFGFRADEVTASTPAADNIIICDGSLTNDIGNLSYDSGPTILPTSDADNRVQFSMTGRASNSCDVLMTLRTRHRFRFQPTESGRLTASAFYTPGLLVSIACDGEQGLFNLFDKAGPVHFTHISVLSRACESPGCSSASISIGV
ncbi:MAG: hypothetical protein FJW30_26150 [Acidobacteria bacterium]|nr:hypothetical protein [Acidobacteriota bacterium]